jgi:hypothetical protein
MGGCEVLVCVGKNKSRKIGVKSQNTNHFDNFKFQMKGCKGGCRCSQACLRKNHLNYNESLSTKRWGLCSNELLFHEWPNTEYILKKSTRLLRGRGTILKCRCDKIKHFGKHFYYSTSCRLYTRDNVDWLSHTLLARAIWAMLNVL